MRGTLLLILLTGMAGCSSTEPIDAVAQAQPAPTVAAWSGTTEPIATDVAVAMLNHTYGGAWLVAEGGELACHWQVPGSHTSQCLIDDIVLVNATSSSGQATMMEGAPPGEFVFSHVVLAENSSVVYRADQTVPAPAIGGLVFDYMEACAPSWFGTSVAEPTYGRWRVEAVGGRIDATWRAPDFADGAYAEGASINVTLLQDGALLVADADPLATTLITMGPSAAPEIESSVSQDPSSHGECDNTIHGETVAWPLTFTWTPWHGEPVDLSQDPPFQVWQVLIG